MKTQIFFYEYGSRPDVSSVFSGCIRKFLKTLSRVEIFFIRYEYVYVWTVVSGNFRIRFRHSLGSSLHGEHYSYGAKEMAPKSELCACSFQDSLRQNNWALEQIRKFPDTVGYVWTAENDSNTLRVDTKIFASAKKYFRKKKFTDTCGHGLSNYIGIMPPSYPCK